MNSSPVSISLVLSPDDDSFAGRATSESGSRDFTGWIGLMAAIDALLSLERPEEDQ